MPAYGDRYAVTCFDSLDYCASRNNFKAVAQSATFHFVKGDICAPKDVGSVLRSYHIDSIIHFAARSHVDTSLNDPLSFTRTNVIGTQVLLGIARKLGSSKRFIHVSTDEVYGENDTQRPLAFTKEQSLHPTSPYSASKAAAEMIVQAYRKSSRMPAIIVRCNTVFGPHQFPESRSPPTLLLASDPLIKARFRAYPALHHSLEPKEKNADPWRWSHISAFLWAGDAVEALDVIFHRGPDGETHNISSNDHLQVGEVAEKIFRCFHPDGTHELDDWIEYVLDRPFNDSMYWTDDSKLRAFGWKQRTNFDEVLQVTVDWYCRESEGFWPNCDGSASTVALDGDIVIAEGDRIRAV
ncbi:dTDP-D-glucose 4,6-dehydratase [Aspergillus pseudonomiae]|uniref:dTDP-D-glucose 4,6-dehydratase n=1 Tax=Aspergillus pseudonomiae TaxID=1506151 RepID=A0A5N7D308_9EURO|nr:dTDP-D-glucose 4,6-dehydratase [Aspergillus pseudonomiae]KAE8400263.1 dTDP-D-glucose 4,6-dehydratase [Aspergillus pseudonomiae]